MPIRHVTLTPNVVETVTVEGGDGYDHVAVFHRANVSNDVWATVNDTDPVAEADDNYYVPSGARRSLGSVERESSVRLLSAGAVKVEVEFA